MKLKRLSEIRQLHTCMEHHTNVAHTLVPPVSHFVSHSTNGDQEAVLKDIVLVIPQKRRTQTRISVFRYVLKSTVLHSSSSSSCSTF